MGSTQTGTHTISVSPVSGMKLPLASKLVILSGSMVNFHEVVMMTGLFPLLGLKKFLLQGEKVWADGGYRGDSLKKEMGRGHMNCQSQIPCLVSFERCLSP
jgi:hypothetical protein